MSGVEEKLVSLVLFTDDEEDSGSPKASERGERDEEFRSLEEEIERKEGRAKRLQQSRKNGLETSVELLEDVLMSKLHLYGPEAEEVFDTCEQLTLAYNTYAMRLLDRGDFEGAHELLKKAEVLTDKDSELSRTRKPVSRLRAVTFNNLGCLYKHRRNFYTAIKYLERALSIDESTSYAENPASTHLNLCATLSMCNRHDKALNYANAALRILNKQLSLKLSSKVGDFKAAYDRHKSHRKLLSTLAIAYHNAATQHEYLNQFEEADVCYRQAKTVGGLCWKANSPMSASLRQSYTEFKNKLLRHKRSRYLATSLSANRRRPQSAGPRIASPSKPGPQPSPSKVARPRKKKVRPASASAKFAKVPINTVRIYRGESPLPSHQEAKENIVTIPSAKAKQNGAARGNAARPGSARPAGCARRTMEPWNSTWTAEEGGGRHRRNRPKSARL